MSQDLAVRVRPLGRKDPAELFARALAGRRPAFLDSSSRGSDLGRYSFLGANPAGWFRSGNGRSAWSCPWSEDTHRGNPLEALGRFLETLPRLRRGRITFPFRMGLIGYLAYDLGRYVERIDNTKGPDLGTPDIHLALYTDLVVVDHVWGEAFSVRLRGPIRFEPPPIPEPLRVPEDPKPHQPLDREAYLASIQEALEAIDAGEIFQVNLSQRFALPIEGSAGDAYLRLRSRTPAPFGAYLDAGDYIVLSASPERFLRLRGRDVETRPIKGTRPRGPTPQEDRRLAAELQSSEKDAAENVMIVDLERNDLGKVCEFGSVRVDVLRGLISLPTVHHLESVVRGRLREEVTVPDLLRATFPGGSITGAPKPRAMEIIERLEPHRRGVYTGALGYLGLDGGLDLNLAIRTATVVRGTAHFAVGGGIVADSDPDAEYRETLDKLRGHAEALTGGAVEVGHDRLRVARR